MQERDAQVIIIIGRNGTGKSTFCEKIVKAIKSKSIVVTYNGLPKIWRNYPKIDLRKSKDLRFKRGIKQVIAAEYEVSRKRNDLFELIYKRFSNGIVVFDDARGYISSNVDDDKYFRHLLLDFRHRMLDLIFVVHSPADVPPRVWGSATTVFVGSTDSLVNKAQVKTDSAPRIIEIQKFVNEQFRKAKAKNNGSHYGIFQIVRL